MTRRRPSLASPSCRWPLPCASPEILPRWSPRRAPSLDDGVRAAEHSCALCPMPLGMASPITHGGAHVTARLPPALPTRRVTTSQLPHHRFESRWSPTRRSRQARPHSAIASSEPGIQGHDMIGNPGYRQSARFPPVRNYAHARRGQSHTADRGQDGSDGERQRESRLAWRRRPRAPMCAWIACPPVFWT